MKASLSTHVLDQVSGRPAAGLAVTLLASQTILATAETNADGRVPRLAESLSPGVYTLRFATGPWFAAQGGACFYPQVEITFVMTGDLGHYHVPLLLSPYGFATYRGS